MRTRWLKRGGRNATLALLALTAAGAADWLLGHHTLRAAEKPAPSRQALPVVKADVGDLSQQIELPGEFLPYQEVDVETKVKGFVKTLNVDVGSTVRADQLLAELEVPETRDSLARADAAVKRARQRAAQSRALARDAQAMYQRLAAVMRERGDLIAQQDIDQARARADAATAASIADRSAVDEALAQQHELQDMMSYARIRAPFDGVVTRLYTNVGALLGEGADHGRSVVHLAQLDHLRLVVHIPESLVPRLREGAAAEVVVPALGVHRALPIARLSHQLDLSTRTMHAEMDYPNADHGVTPGLYATVQLPADTRRQVVSLPLQAIKGRREQRGHVLVLRGDGSLENRDVTLGLINATRAEIVDGVRAGEMVVVGAGPVAGGNITYVPRLVAVN